MALFKKKFFFLILFFLILSISPDDEPRLSSKFATVQNKPKNSLNRPKVRIKLPPFVAYGGGCSSREIGDMKTYNVNAANHVSNFFYVSM